MAKQTSVQAAYHKLGGKNNGASLWGRCSSLVVFIVVALFLMALSGGDSKGKHDDEIMVDLTQAGQQASRPINIGGNRPVVEYEVGPGDVGTRPVMPASHTAALPTTNTANAGNNDNTDDATVGDDDVSEKDDATDDNMGDGNSYIKSDGKESGSASSNIAAGGSDGANGGYKSGGGSSSSSAGLRGSNGDSEQDMSNVVEVANQGIINVEEAELQKDEAMLSSSVKGMGFSIRSSLAGWLRKGTNDAEVEQMAEAVEAEVNREVKDELEENALAIQVETIQTLESQAEQADEMGADIAMIEQNVRDFEKKALVAVPKQIDQKALAIKDKLAFKTAMVEKELMEQRLSQELGFQVKLTVVDDRLQGVDQALTTAQQMKNNNINNYYNNPPLPQGGYTPTQNAPGGYAPTQNAPGGYVSNPNLSGAYTPNPNSQAQGGYAPNPNSQAQGGYAPNPNSQAQGGYYANPNPQGGYTANPNTNSGYNAGGTDSGSLGDSKGVGGGNSGGRGGGWGFGSVRGVGGG